VPTVAEAGLATSSRRSGCASSHPRNFLRSSWGAWRRACKRRATHRACAITSVNIKFDGLDRALGRDAYRGPIAATWHEFLLGEPPQQSRLSAVLRGWILGGRRHVERRRQATPSRTIEPAKRERQSAHGEMGLA
jgi:hypothetical protein